VCVCGVLQGHLRTESPASVHALAPGLALLPNTLFYLDVVASELATKGVSRTFPTRCLLKGACLKWDLYDILSSQSPPSPDQTVLPRCTASVSLS
jgi:hypothetical protein